MDNTRQLNTIAALLQQGINVTLTSGDIEIGAVEIKDGTTDTRGTVKAASTAAVATDTAVVVALSPNNTPVGHGTAAAAMRVELPTDGTGVIATVNTVSAVTAITNALPAGTNLMGKVGIDQTTPGTTNATSIAQIGSNTVNTGTGAAGVGTLRVATSTDSTIGTVTTLTSGNVGGFTTYVSSTITMSVAGAYATGDYMGTTTTPQSFSSVVRTSGGTGIINSITISDKITNANVAMELWLFSATFTAPTDNAAWTVTDGEALTVLGVIPIITSKWYASGANQIYYDDTIRMIIKTAATSLFYALVAKGTTPAFTSGDLTLNLGILQD